ncbi:serine/threonine-protein kinase [Nitrosovibrio tenuis]|uniref:serine/threonine-protein kinase n=1 Tax=Nitrosovibrio tenuis TaxID=1233 RepID=UPI0015A6A9F0|nr:serine/threonine-protein kinase [Nitrosovibrio tenuis]
MLEQVIGRGGMGTVWRAKNVTSGQTVAIKVIAEGLLAEPGVRARFQNEVSRHARLNHPNIVRLLETFSVTDQQCMVMNFIEGEPLAALLKRSPDHALPLDVSLRIFSDILRALDYAHRHGIFHRDVKPSNILLDSAKRANLLDFGIALAVGEARLTRMGMPVGTAAYMSPEQIRTPAHIDHRTDVYSAGCVLYEMLTGRPPFLHSELGGTTADLALRSAHVNLKPVPPHQRRPSIPVGVSDVIMSALNKDPDQRPQGCAEFLRLLTAEDQPQGIQQRWAGLMSNVPLRFAVGAALLAIATGLVMYIWGTAPAK